MNKIMIRHLAMIITENCNLNCEMCLRGQGRNCYMSDEVIEATLSQFKHIRVLTLSGGEPLLALKQIEKIIMYIIKHNIIVDHLDFVINGTIYSKDFIDILYLYDKKTNFERDINISISKDKYHEAEIERLNLMQKYLFNISLYKESKYFNDFHEIDEKRIIRQGNAENLDDKLTIPFEPLMPNSYTYIKYLKDPHYISCSAVNAKGIITEIDASYINQETIYNYGNVLNESIESAIKRYKKQ